MFDVFGFYKFIKISYLKKNQKILHNHLLNKNIRGTIIISNEGLNGPISGKNKDIKLIKDCLNKLFKFEKFDSINNSKSSFQPFQKPKVKIKKEVVPMNLSLKKQIKKKNSHVNPQKWNSLIKDKKTVLIDARKPFEYKVGTFKGSINPDVDNFRDFPKYLKKVDGWDVESVNDKDYYIIKNLKFNNFLESQEFINKVGQIAEQEGHHLDI